MDDATREVYAEFNGSAEQLAEALYKTRCELSGWRASALIKSYLLDKLQPSQKKISVQCKTYGVRCLHPSSFARAN